MCGPEGTSGTNWLDQVRASLDRRTVPVLVFVRDDDAGWDDDRLDRLIDVAAGCRAPLDIAVIPAELTESRAGWLMRRRSTYPSRLGLHQHGWAHVNHEPTGVRKCEFGYSRSVSALQLDLARGRRRLLERLPGAVDPIFTPPWNRCAPAVGPLLVDAGFTVLSRDRSAPMLGLDRLRECPTSIDWFARHRGVPRSPAARAAAIAGALATETVVGLLLHHAVTDAGELGAIQALLDVLSAHERCRLISLLEASQAGDMCSTAPVGGAAAWQ